MLPPSYMRSVVMLRIFVLTYSVGVVDFTSHQPHQPRTEFGNCSGNWRNIDLSCCDIDGDWLGEAGDTTR